MKIISVRENPEFEKATIEYLQKIWANEDTKVIYEDCIHHCIGSDNPLPQWYLLVDDEALMETGALATGPDTPSRIVGCAGLITNDFISRMDLYPWICALYIEKAHRGQELGKLLMEKACYDAVKAGFPIVYLCTDHVGYYERYGFEFIGEGYHPWGESSRIYQYSLDKTHGGSL